MTDLAVLIPLALDQLQVAVLAARPFDFGLLDEQVATTLQALSDRRTAGLGPQLPQHYPPRQRKNRRKPAPRRTIRSNYPPSTAENGASCLEFADALRLSFH